MKKVCMILGNPFINDNRVLREAGALAKAGYQVKLFASYQEGLPSREIIDDFEVIRPPVKNYSPFRLKIYPYYSEFYKSYRRLAQEKADIYHSHDLDTLLIGFLAAKANNAKIIYDSHEYWPSRTKFARNFMDKAKGFIREPIFKLMEMYLIKRVNAVVAANETSAEVLAKYYKIEKPLSVYNYHSLKYQQKSDILRKVLNLENKKIVLYLGGINKGRGILKLVEAMVYLPPAFHLVFLGEGPYKDPALELAKRVKVENRIHFPKAVPPTEVIKWASGVDVGVSPIENISQSYYFSSPNKVFEYLMAGLPIAVSDFPEMRRIFNKYEVGEMFNPEDPKLIAAAIKKILANTQRYKKLKENALRAAREEYNWEMESKKLIKLYKNL